jgi:molybdopterin-biosynthesis enzyme MoeA-like protein
MRKRADSTSEAPPRSGLGGLRIFFHPPWPLGAFAIGYTYVFTTGGIGPTHSDITADCVAKAFGVPIDSDPRALAILHEWVKTTGAEMNKARLRLTRIPKGADLIPNKVSGAPGFWIGNVIPAPG